MKILHIISGLSMGGAEMMLYKLLSLTDRSQFSPVVISLTDDGILGENIINLDIPVYQIGLNSGIPNPFKIWQLRKLVRELNPELIQGWMYHGNLAALMVKKILTKRVSLLWNIRHTPGDLKKEKRLTAMMIRLGACFSHTPESIIYNARVSEQRHRQLGYSGKDITIIPNGFDCEQFKPTDVAKLKLLNLLNLRKDSLLIGLVARYHKMKGHKNFLFAVEKLIEAFPNIHFVLAGSGIDEKNIKLKKQINHLKINKNIHLLGERRDIAEITAGLDIACSSSVWGEGFSNAIGEAMACGVPCVVTDVGDSAWIVDKTGLVVKPGDKIELTDALKEMIEMGADMRKQLGKLARQRIIKHFSLDKVVKKYEQIYREKSIARIL